MPDRPDKLSHFWKELKRRNVVRVITVYAASAFVILELVDIITEPFGLPAWTLKFVVVILAVGLIVAIILSWIYDVHPDDGIVKTGPSEQQKQEESLKPSNSWKIASYISFTVIIGLIVLNILPRTDRKELLEKSIAVLPFKNDSPDESKMYFINGTMEAILENLCKISDLRVVSRTSVEQYRNKLIPVPQIAREMKVSYVLEGSGHRDGNNVRIVVQLLDGRKDEHIWSKTYDTTMEEIFSMESEIARLVAGEIKALISPEEKQLIEKIPTANLTAYDLYQKGREAQRLFEMDYNNRALVASAESLYRQALQQDSTFALAYLGLAKLTMIKYTWNPYQNEEIVDSILIFTNLALSCDSQLAEAYIFKGYYYRMLNDFKQALQLWDKAITLNPNSAEPYKGMGWAYSSQGNYVKSIENFVRASSLDRGPELPSIIENLGFALTSIGFYANSKAKYLERLHLNGDSADYLYRMSYAEFCAGHYNKAIETGQMAISRGIDIPYVWNYIANSYINLGQYEEALPYFQEFTEKLNSEGRINFYSLPWVAYAYLQNGFNAESEIYINEQINLAEEWIKRGYGGYEGNYMRLAMVYAIRGDSEQALENLRIYNKTGITSVHDMKLRTSPLFETIRGEPEFQQIIGDLEDRYQAEHERVRQWLEENEML